MNGCRRALGIGAVLLATTAGWAQGQVRKPPIEAEIAAAPIPAPGNDDALATRAAMRIASPARHVLALYYPWYGTPQKSGKWLHQDGVEVEKKSIGSHAHYPAAGPYDSTDLKVIETHLDQAKSAGIDTLVCSWWGPQDPTDKAFKAVLGAAAGKGMSVCILWERLSGKHDADAARADLSYLLATFGKQQGYLREGGSPVVFALAPVCQALPPEEWATVVAEVSRQYQPGVRIIGEGNTQADLLLWDGTHSLGYLAQMAERSPTIAARVLKQANRIPILLGRTAGRISVVTLSPGCDERKLGKRLGQRTSLVIEREDGRLYRALWEQAIQDNPDWIVINSFNQWHSGTEIEPSVEFGDRYLTLTRELTAQFRKLPVRK